MSWFQIFVDEVVEAWGNRMIKEGKLNTVEKGKRGENFVKDILEKKKGYTVALSKGSRSPSDVWGIRWDDRDDKDDNLVVHIALIQVKTAVTQKKPEEIDDKNEEELKELACLTLERFQEFEDKPETLTNKFILISTGYAGIVVEGEQPRVSSTKYVDCVHSNGKFEKDMKDVMKDWLSEFHKLQ